MHVSLQEETREGARETLTARDLHTSWMHLPSGVLYSEAGESWHLRVNTLCDGPRRKTRDLFAGRYVPVIGKNLDVDGSIITSVSQMSSKHRNPHSGGVDVLVGIRHDMATETETSVPVSQSQIHWLIDLIEHFIR